MLAHNLNRMAGLDGRRVNREDFRINDGKRSRLNLLFSDQHFDRAALRLRGDFHLDYILIPPLDERRNSSEEHTIDLRGFELSEPLADNRHRGPRDSGLWLQFDLRRRGAGRPAARPSQHQARCKGNDPGFHRKTGLKHQSTLSWNHPQKALRGTRTPRTSSGRNNRGAA